MQFSAMQTEVFRRLNEDSSAPNFWTAAQVKAALNDGYAELCEATGAYQTVQSSVALIALHAYYKLNVILTYPVVRITSVWNNQTSRWLTPVGIRDLDVKTDPRWESLTGAPEKWFMRSPLILGIFPKSAATSGTIDIYYQAIPTALSADADTPSFPADFHHGMVEYAIYDLLCQEGEVKLALEHWTRYLGYEHELHSYVQLRTQSRVGGWYA